MDLAPLPPVMWPETRGDGARAGDSGARKATARVVVLPGATDPFSAFPETEPQHSVSMWGPQPVFLSKPGSRQSDIVNGAVGWCYTIPYLFASVFFSPATSKEILGKRNFTI